MCPKPTTPPSRAGRQHASGARRLLVVFLGVVLIAGLWWALRAGPKVPLADWTALFLVRLEHIPPWVYLISFVVLPAFGVPIFAYYLTIGVVIDGLGLTLLAAWTCMAANMALSYLLARGLHYPLKGLATRRGYRIPRLRPADEWKIIVMVRASPLPWMMQNYLLALGGARFRPYMLFGVPVQALIGLGVILLGDAILSGDIRWALVGLFLVAAVWVTLRIMRGRGEAVLGASWDRPEA
ncbi:putative SNARE associated Golgi protein [Thiocapsa sp. KS1]|nr:hypothetical protein [Thiocapsa sp. KS1]CRI65714.1 putative SNARE associated Golgi protein [Thiocapsa sp. KS1]